MSANILIVDDEPAICSLLSRRLASGGERRVRCCTDPVKGLQSLGDQACDVVITDLQMPGMDGLEFLRRSKTIRPECNVVMMTGHASVETARRALKNGAADYLAKPIDVKGELEPLISQLLSNPPPSEAPTSCRGFASRSAPRAVPASEAIGADQAFVGSGDGVRKLVRRARKVARSSAPVLLRGESGTGKELVAGMLHRLSPRANRPFIKINCAALPETLLESELFGYVKGAFTGATQDREGLFQAADGGTLLLDEIGEISRTFQPKLLRVLQEGELHRIGDARHVVQVDVRVIAATNRDLESAIRAGEFREDLYYRLSVVPLEIPPLRQRIEDIPALLTHFSHRFCPRTGRRETPAFSQRALDGLRRYPWPGNIRELANAVEYAMILGEGEVLRFEDLPDAIQAHDGRADEREPLGRRVGTGASNDAKTLADIERRCIVEALERTAGNRTRAAQQLGVTRRTLGYRMRKYGLDDEGEGQGNREVGREREEQSEAAVAGDASRGGSSRTRLAPDQPPLPLHALN